MKAPVKPWASPEQSVKRAFSTFFGFARDYFLALPGGRGPLRWRDRAETRRKKVVFPFLTLQEFFLRFGPGLPTQWPATIGHYQELILSKTKRGKKRRGMTTI